MNEYLPIIVGAAAVALVFGLLWWSGNLKRLTAYVQETREELRKCTWPSVDELKGSTVVVMIAIAILGGFTVAVDFVLAMVISWIQKV